MESVLVDLLPCATVSKIVSVSTGAKDIGLNLKFIALCKIKCPERGLPGAGTRHPGLTAYFTNSKLSFNRMSLDEAPIMRSNSPGSATHCSCWL